MPVAANQINSVHMTITTEVSLCHNHTDSPIEAVHTLNYWKKKQADYTFMLCFKSELLLKSYITQVIEGLGEAIWSR